MLLLSTSVVGRRRRLMVTNEDDVTLLYLIKRKCEKTPGIACMSVLVALWSGWLNVS